MALLILVSLIVVQVSFGLWLIRVTAKIVRTPVPSWGRATVALVGLIVLGVIATIMSSRFEATELAKDSGFWIVPLLVLLVLLLCYWGLVHWAIESPTKQRSVLAVAIFVAALAAVSFPLSYVVREFVIETYANSTNGMSPTLAGLHEVGKCPHCGGTTIVSVPLSEARVPPNVPRIAMCEACRQSSQAETSPQNVLGGDRFCCEKFAQPKRWDIVTFRYPRDPKIVYVKRLVGLPGEKLAIKDGGIWINGERLEPPTELKGMRWTNQKFSEFGDGVHLGDEQYYVLGDNTEASADSRYWGPVPANNLIGVVTLRYWPLSRFKIFR